MKVINTNKNYWKKISREFNQYVEKGSWNNERSIKLSHTSLFPNHSVGRGPNSGEPTLLDFSTKLMEASAVYFHYESRFSSLEVYIRSKTNSVDKTFFEVRKNNKNKDFIYNRYNDDKNAGWFLKDILKAAGKEYFYDADDIKEALIAQGYTIVTQFEFSNVVSFRMPHHSGSFLMPQYVKRTKTALEIGWFSSGTYNSIPNVLKVEFCRKIKTTSLSELGIEKSGYYSHSYHCKILPSQAKQAKQFFNKRFK